MVIWLQENDRELSPATPCRLERVGITTIAIYLGADPDDLSQAAAPPIQHNASRTPSWRTYWV